ncbi:LamG-like jellyroll fold domain-containing protein [Flavivirga spongiicola]|uniref:Endonuclease/exonuclease/phosphatase domain-containing protein n=1 Tax=Flavivirga spongiicola TaxID=421621 RepID=A0ABU7XNL7_9FLAO|nr:LamG-like jellyroll fold domain-containing protein [Flavivirga sp. MEBiC05379]MDO5977360.1 LamG-like jellyroll fold domain-containing protein [Flavivirga sp. MEBiC05379]
MKKTYKYSVITMLMLSLAIVTNSCSYNPKIRIASFNILSGQFKFNMELGPRADDYEYKRMLQVRYIDSVQPDIILLQEAEPLYEQIDYIIKKMPWLQSVKASNGLSILYHKNKFELLNHGYVRPISLQHASLKHVQSGKKLNVLNMHLAGEAGSLLNLRKIMAWASQHLDMNHESTLLAGDMNASLTSKYYDQFINDFPVFNDPNHNDALKFNKELIDWILLNKGFKLVGSGWKKAKLESRFISDHPIVWADLNLTDVNDNFDFDKASRPYLVLDKQDKTIHKYFSVHSEEIFHLKGQNYFLSTENQLIIDAKQYSVGFWLNSSIENNQLGQNYLITNQGYPFGWEVELRSGVPYFEARIESGQGKKSKGVKISGNTMVEANKWYHILVSIDEENDAKLYLNGILEGSVSLSGKIAYHKENPGIFIGTRWDLRNIFKGKITKPVFYKTIINSQKLNTILESKSNMTKEDMELFYLNFKNKKQ